MVRVFWSCHNCCYFSNIFDYSMSLCRGTLCLWWLRTYVYRKSRCIFYINMQRLGSSTSCCLRSTLLSSLKFKWSSNYQIFRCPNTMPSFNEQNGSCMDYWNHSHFFCWRQPAIPALIQKFISSFSQSLRFCLHHNWNTHL